MTWYECRCGREMEVKNSRKDERRGWKCPSCFAIDNPNWWKDAEAGQK